MEKYARQSIAEGVSADQVEVTTELELYKILNLHYNRNNQIEVGAQLLSSSVNSYNEKYTTWLNVLPTSCKAFSM